MPTTEHDCPGLWECRDHPKSRVVISRLTGRFYVIDAGRELGWNRARNSAAWATLYGAIDTARVRAGRSL